MENEREKCEVPIYQKEYLSLAEASALFGIGINHLREMTNSAYADCALFVGKRRLIKRRMLMERLDREASI